MRIAAANCHIRTMEPGDIAQVLDIERQSFPTMWPQTVYQRELKNSMARYLVAYEPLPSDPPAGEDYGEGRPRLLGGLVRRFFGGLPVEASREPVLGMVGLWLMVDEAHIVTIAVRQGYRRQGLGELLLVAALEAARDAGMETVTLEYRISNAAARRLYEKYGFAKVGVRAGYYSDNNEDAVLMTTPPIRSPEYRELLAARVDALRARWGAGFPFGDAARHRLEAPESG
jgi:ribosomal-protein-alanine N-acetyltransferase